MLGLDANVVRKGSASCHVSPLSDAGIMSTTRTPGVGGGGGGGEDSPFGGRSQAATTNATAARRVVARMARGYTRGARGFGVLIPKKQVPRAFGARDDMPRSLVRKNRRAGITDRMYRYNSA